MGVELRPLGVACNIACTYCYQQPQRDARNVRARYDIELMKAAVERDGGPFTLFGGEPLLMPLDDLEELFRWGHTKFGRNSVQTNGTLITDEHIELFKRYDVMVGISIDGPDELNAVRRSRTRELTREMTAKTEGAIRTLTQVGRPPSLIVTLHRGNAVAAALPRMESWFESLDELGIKAVRLHVLEVDGAVARQLALNDAENLAAFRTFARLESRLRNIRFDVFQDMKALLRGDDSNATCVWRACDPYTTAAVTGIEGDGASSNCGRTNKEGVDFPKAEQPGFERYVSLAMTPYAEGGCGGCRFLFACKGQCPGTAVAGDWRNKTEHCDVWYELFAEIERSMIIAGETPLSIQPIRAVIEGRLVDEWAAGSNPSVASVSRAVWRESAEHLL